MPIYPLELNLVGRPVLVVGGGAVAARKVAGLVAAEARVRVLSPEFVPELLRRDDIEREVSPYRADRLGSAVLVFACTDNRELNARVADDARAAERWCGIADDPANSDFFVPAVLRRGNLTVAVGTAGAAPHLAASLRDRLESQLGAELGMLVEELGRARNIVREKVADHRLRRRIFATLCGDNSVELLKSGGSTAWRHWLDELLSNPPETRAGPHTTSDSDADCGQQA